MCFIKLPICIAEVTNVEMYTKQGGGEAGKFINMFCLQFGCCRVHKNSSGQDKQTIQICAIQFHLLQK